jgi:hypothetical protein
MTSEQFRTLSLDLRRVAKEIPLSWGHVQNNRYDNELKHYCNIFAVMSLDELKTIIDSFDNDHKSYYLRRWYLLRCADCDEYLFYINPNVIHNPNRFDKEWDIKINGHLLFDIKGTVIPQSMRGDISQVINSPENVIQFYYDQQSTGVRYDMQNRLFVVHHSMVDSQREFYLRCAWGSKASIYQRFAERAEEIKFFEYKGCTTTIIYIIETEKNKVQYMIAGLDPFLRSLTY